MVSLADRSGRVRSHMTLLRCREYTIQCARLIDIETTRPMDIMRECTHMDSGSSISQLGIGNWFSDISRSVRDCSTPTSASLMVKNRFISDEWAYLKILTKSGMFLWDFSTAMNSVKAL
jgi:hypothetical protein